MSSDNSPPNGIRRPPNNQQVALLGGWSVLWSWLRTPAGLVTFFTSVGLALTALTVALSLTYNGYCISERRYLSEREMFDTAILEVIKSRTYPRIPSVSRWTRIDGWRMIPYKNIDDFKAQNPNCCRWTARNVGDSAPFVSLSDQLFGAANHFIAVDYIARYLDGNNNEQREATTAHIRLSACGRIWHPGR